MRILFLCLFLTLHANVVQRIEALRTIGDHDTAIRLAKAAAEPECERLMILSYADRGDFKRALALYHRDDDAMLEAICWSAIREGATSPVLIHRLAAMIGAASTQDVQAVSVLLEGIRAPQPHLRGVAIQLASMLRDRPLQKEIARLLQEEPSWETRLQAIAALGAMQVKALRPKLLDLIGSERVSAEEKSIAIQAVIQMTETDEGIDLDRLARNPRAGFRQLACEVIAHLELDRTDILLDLLKDTRPDVKVTALRALGFLHPDISLDTIQPLLHDIDSRVAITAAWLLTLYDAPEGIQALRHHLATDEARLAAAALAHSGPHGVSLAAEMLSHQDPYVRGNLAIALLGQRIHTRAAADTLHSLLSLDEKWMWKEEIFRTLAPSEVRHSPVVANAPEVANQLTRLQVIGMLAVVEHPAALEACKQFLGHHEWGITGMAALTLLQEGDEAALDLIRELRDDPNRNVRLQAAIGLAIWGKDSSAISTLEEAYSGAARDQKITILEALGAIGSRDSIPFLITALNEPFHTLRILAAASILHCINS